MTKNMGMEFFLGPMAEFILVNGKMGNKMEKEFTSRPKAKKEKDNGLVVKE